jgi:hypothetical protein
MGGVVVYSIWRGAGKFQWPRKYDIQKGLRVQYVPRIPMVPLPDLEDMNVNPEAMRQKVTNVAVPAIGVMLLVPLALVDSPGHHQKGGGSSGFPIGGIGQLIHSKVVSQKSKTSPSSKQSTPVASSLPQGVQTSSVAAQPSQSTSSALAPLSSLGSTVNAVTNTVTGSAPVVGGLGGGEVTAPLPNTNTIIPSLPTTPIPSPTPVPTVPTPSQPIPDTSASAQVNTPVGGANANVTTSPLSASVGATVGPVSVGVGL